MLGQHPRLELSTPRLMAVLNATPDSFSDGGLLYKNNGIDASLVQVRLDAMVSEGADIIDVGGESTRPGATPITVQEELDRVIPVVELAVQTGLAISVDTSSPEVMLEAANKGAHLINDVRALTREGALAAAVSTGLPVCLMHMQGTPETMQLSPTYSNIVVEVSEYLQHRVRACLEAGISASNICLDPGFGFGKTVEHNVQLLRQLPEIRSLGFPVLAGLSRKSMIGHLLKKDVADRLPASLALALMSLQGGANIIRVHDVAATRDIIDIYSAVLG